jgi:hypothetical protein
MAITPFFISSEISVQRRRLSATSRNSFLITVKSLCRNRDLVVTPAQKRHNRLRHSPCIREMSGTMTDRGGSPAGLLGRTHQTFNISCVLCAGKAPRPGPWFLLFRVRGHSGNGVRAAGYTTSFRVWCNPASVSCILLNNVLEHLYDPMRVLAKSARGLMSGGSLVLIVAEPRFLVRQAVRRRLAGLRCAPPSLGLHAEAARGAVARFGLAVDACIHSLPSLWVWQSTIDDHHQAALVPAWGRRHARRLTLALLPFGWLAAACGHDFVTVVARKAPG